MAAATHQMTADDLLHMPDDGCRYELVRGELRKMTPAGYKHGMMAARITRSLANHVMTCNLGEVFAAETGFKLASDPDMVRAPDVAFISRERLLSAGNIRDYWPGAPDLAVEVLSPGDGYSEVQEKVFDWLHAGTRMVIIADPDKRIVTIYRSPHEFMVLGEADMIDGDEVVPGWLLPIKEVFA